LGNKEVIMTAMILSVRKYSVRAVPNGPGLTGITRMVANEAHTRVLGACLIFEQHPQNGLTLAYNSQFFYGSLSDYKGTVRLRRYTDDEMMRFADRRFGSIDRAAPRVAYALVHMKYFYIPKEKVGYCEQHQRLLDRLIAEVEEQLPDWLRVLTPAPCQKGKNFDFKGFPAAFMEQARAVGSYYKKDIRYQERTAYSIPRPRFIRTPMGGLPNWARHYQR
jgi:hypothetical protein